MLHFGMTGFLKYFKNAEEAPGHIRLLIDFENGFHLAYDCRRKLGLIDLTDDYEQFIKQKELGIDPLRENLDFALFKRIIQDKKGSVKSCLMDQQLIAGIGNSYSDEILFQSKIHPKSSINKLNETQLQTIFSKMKEVIETAIEKQVDPAQFPKSYLLPNRNPDESCPVCDSKIIKSKISGRSSYFCTEHQKSFN